MSATPASPVYWCHQCKKWQPTKPEGIAGGEFYCVACGETIECDECGQPWTDDHDDECEANR